MGARSLKSFREGKGSEDDDAEEGAADVKSAADGGAEELEGLLAAEEVEVLLVVEVAFVAVALEAGFFAVEACVCQ